MCQTFGITDYGWLPCSPNTLFTCTVYTFTLKMLVEMFLFGYSLEHVLLITKAEDGYGINISNRGAETLNLFMPHVHKPCGISGLSTRGDMLLGIVTDWLQPRCAIARQIDIYEDHSLWCYVSGTQVRMQLGWCSVMHCLVSDMAGCPGPVCLAAGRIPGPWSIGLLVTLDLLSTLLQALCTAASCNILSFWIRVKGNYLHFCYKYFSICDKCLFNVPRAFYNPIHWCLSLSLYSFKLSLRWLVLSSLCEFYKKNVSCSVPDELLRTGFISPGCGRYCNTFKTRWIFIKNKSGHIAMMQVGVKNNCHHD